MRRFLFVLRGGLKGEPEQATKERVATSNKSLRLAENIFQAWGRDGGNVFHEKEEKDECLLLFCLLFLFVGFFQQESSIKR